MENLFKRIRLLWYTRQLRKENLILINSFGTNSYMLQPVIEYFSYYFNVYFIDLPGFIKSEAPLKTVSIDDYTRHVQEKVREFNLPNYILGGISFGFFIANRIKLDNSCKALFAMEPYVGVECLRVDRMHEVIYIDLLTIIGKLQLIQPIWKNRYFPKLLEMLTSLSPHQIKETLENIDAKTFLETARLLLTEHDRLEFKQIPYILGINKHDDTINAPYVIEEFQQNVKELFILHNNIAHYPKELTLEYMRTNIKEKDMFAMIRWISRKKKLQNPLYRS